MISVTREMYHVPQDPQERKSAWGREGKWSHRTEKVTFGVKQQKGRAEKAQVSLAESHLCLHSPSWSATLHWEPGGGLEKGRE